MKFHPLHRRLRNSRLLPGIFAALSATVLLLGGCSKGNDKTAGDDHDDHHHHHHGEHPSVGPHKGQILEWGDHKYHVEITFQRDQQQTTIYILDHDVKNPQPVAIASPQLKLDGVDRLIDFKPLPLEGESTEKSSRYVATDPALASAEKFSGVVSGNIDGTQYFEQFKEADAKDADAHEGHDAHDDHEAHEDHEGHEEHDAHDDDAHHDDDHKEHKDDDHANGNAPAHSDADHSDADHSDADHGEGDHGDEATPSSADAAAKSNAPDGNHP